MGRPTESAEMPLQPQVSLDPFYKWIYIVGPINPPSNQFHYMLVCTDYPPRMGGSPKPYSSIIKIGLIDFLKMFGPIVQFGRLLLVSLPMN